MRIYHTATQEDYDALMTEFEENGYYWASGNKPTEEFNYKKYTSATTVTACKDVIRYSCVRYEMEFNPEEPIIEYKAKKEGETDDFIQELTVKIYYNEITKKHYNSYDDAIADCKREMERQYDKN